MTACYPDTSVSEVTSAWCALGLWGPNANAILGSVTDDGLDATAVPPYTIRRMFVAGIPVLAVRMSYVGEEGLELHAATEYGAALWEAVWEAGRAWGWWLPAARQWTRSDWRLDSGRWEPI